jgi:hypothetical protein
MAKIKHATLIEEFEDSGMFYFSHCVVCPSLIYSFRLPIWYLPTLLSMWHVLFWPLCFLSFFDLQQPGAVNQRKTDNTMAKRKSTKGQSTI